MGSKLVFVNRFFYPDISATSQMLADLAFAMAERHHVHVVTSRLTYERDGDALPARTQVKQTIVHRVWTSRFGRRSLVGRTADYLTFYASACIQLMFLLERGDVVVSMTDPPLLSLPVAVVSKLKGASLVNWLQDLFPEVAGRLDFKRFRKFLDGPLAWLRDRSLSAAAMNVVLGDLMAETLEKKGIAKDRIRVIPNWASSDRIVPTSGDDNPLRRQWHLDGKFVVGYSGNFGRAHEFGSLIDAATRLSARADIVFLLIGGGRQRAELEQEVASRNLNNVMFQPYQPRALLSQSLSAADCHIVSLKPSLEGLIVPSKVYSAMAAARPVIFLGAPDGEIPRMMGVGFTFGVCLAPDDTAGLVTAIENLSRSPETAARLGRNGRHLFEQRFDQPIAIEKWSALMSALGATPRATAVPAEDPLSGHRDTQVCPSCASRSAHRSRSRTAGERVRRDLSPERLYRCDACGWRGWMMPLDSGGSHPPVDEPAAPDLGALDLDRHHSAVGTARPASLSEFE